MRWKKALYLLLLALLVFAGDAALKFYIHHHLPVISSRFPLYPYGGIACFRDWYGIDFSIVHVVNKGAAWGVFSSLQEYLLYARILIIGALLSYLFFAKASLFRKGGLTLVLAGACGNVLDYFLYGHVVDMFYFNFWGYAFPVFNLADSAIFVGIALLMFQSFFMKMHPKAA